MPRRREDPKICFICISAAKSVMERMTYDVIIVGAGPAGATAGLHLAQQGIRVAILDKAEFPRFKPCGGGLTYRILARFPHLKNELERLTLNRVSTIHLYAPDLSSLRYTYHEPITLMIRRSEFDAMLLDRCRQAGATVITPACVKQIARHADRVDVTTTQGQTLSARAMIGADGAHSLVAKQTGLCKAWRRDQIVASVVAEIPAAECPLADHSTVRILFGFGGWGYGWVFPKQQYVNLGVAGLLSKQRDGNIKAVYTKFLQTLQAQQQIPASFTIQDTRGGIIPITGVLSKTQTERVLLCGDAAGFVNGLTGEGIYYAMVSGELAAKTLIDAFRQHDFSEAMLKHYQTAWQSEIGEEIKQSVHVQQQLLAHPNLLNLLVRTVARHERMKQVFTDYFMGKLTYKALKRALLLRFLPQYLLLQVMKRRRSG